MSAARREPEELARTIRAHALRMVHAADASHIGTCLSMAELIAVLYAGVLRVDPARPQWSERDRFILSKGHGTAILYAALAECGFFPVEELKTFCLDGGRLLGHVSHCVPGVEASTGSLGHGLPIVAGMALAAKADAANWRAFALLGDGELDAGSNWEAMLFAAHHRLDNLVAIVDRNGIQAFGSVEDVLGLEPLADKFRAFGWAVREVDGHNVVAIGSALGQLPFEDGRPSAVIATTVKGKGVSFMEGQLAWHYRSPNDEELAAALAELGVER